MPFTKIAEAYARIKASQRTAKLLDPVDAPRRSATQVTFHQAVGPASALAAKPDASPVAARKAFMKHRVIQKHKKQFPKLKRMIKHATKQASKEIS